MHAMLYINKNQDLDPSPRKQNKGSENNQVRSDISNGFSVLWLRSSVYKLLDEKVKISVISISKVQEDKGKLFNLLTDISEMEKYSKKYHRS